MQQQTAERSDKNNVNRNNDMYIENVILLKKIISFNSNVAWLLKILSIRRVTNLTKSTKTLEYSVFVNIKCKNV